MLHIFYSPSRTACKPHVPATTPPGRDDEASGLLGVMFAARKSVFVDLLGWDVPVLAGRYEMDQFDDEHAVYLMLADPNGRHLASARLLPTMRPHILDSFYAVLCEAGPPRGPTIFEITRFCLDRRLCARQRRQARDRLVRALADHALAQGITAYSAIAEAGWSRQILGFGWRCSPLGVPRRLGGQLLAALRIEIDANTPHMLAQGLIGHPGEPAPGNEDRLQDNRAAAASLSAAREG